jgi:hypothetical protein
MSKVTTPEKHVSQMDSLIQPARCFHITPRKRIDEAGLNLAKWMSRTRFRDAGQAPTSPMSKQSRQIVKMHGALMGAATPNSIQISFQRAEIVAGDGGRFMLKRDIRFASDGRHLQHQECAPESHASC